MLDLNFTANVFIQQPTMTSKFGNKARSENIDVFDHLPQPYRMITKLIEMEIIDKAWLEITRRHPEIQVDSNGEQIILNRNHMLNESFTATRMKSLPSNVASMVETNGIICATDTNGNFSVLSADNYEPIICKDIFDPKGDESDKGLPTVTENGGTSPTPAPTAPVPTAATTAPISKPTDPNQSIPISHLLIGPCMSVSKLNADRESTNVVNFHTRLVVYGLMVTSEPKTLPEGVKKAPPPAKGVPVNPEDNEDKFVRFRVGVVDVFRVMNFAGQPQLTAKLIYEMTLDKYHFDSTVGAPTLDLQRILYEDACFSLSVDGLLLSVSTAGPAGGCKILSLPVDDKQNSEKPTDSNTTLNTAPVVPAVAASGKATAKSGVAVVVTAAPPVEPEKPPPTTNVLAQIDVNSSVLRGFKIQQVVIIPPPAAQNTAIATYIPPPPRNRSQSTVGGGSRAGGSRAGGSVRNGSIAGGDGSNKRPTSSSSQKGSARPGSAQNTPRVGNISARGGGLPPIPGATSAPAATDAATGSTPVDYEKMTVAILLKDAPFWIIFGLRNRAKDVKPPEPADPKAKAPKGAPIEPVAVAPAYLFDLYIIAEWKLTTSVTASATDKRNEIIVLGQHDGEVALWSLAERCLLKILGRHAAPVTCLQLVSEEDFSQFYIISGAQNGTICFYSTAETTPSSSISGGGDADVITAEMKAKLAISMTLRKDANSSSKKRSITAMELKDYRSDLNLVPGTETSSVAQLQTTNNKISSIPLIFAQFSCGTVLVYDFKSFALVGKCNNSERSGFSTITMLPVTHGALPSPSIPKPQVQDSETPAAAMTTSAVPTTAAGKTAAAVAAPQSSSPSVAPVVKPNVRLATRLSCPVATVSGTHFHCLYTRYNVPTMFSHSLTAILKQYAVHHNKSTQAVGQSSTLMATGGGAASGGGVSGVTLGFDKDDASMKSGKSRLTSTSTKGGGRALVSPRTGGMNSNSSAQLRLTAERLNALEMSFHTSVPELPFGGAPPGPPIEVRKEEFNPRRVIQKEVLRSKVEREGRKARLIRSMNEISSLL